MIWFFEMQGSPFSRTLVQDDLRAMALAKWFVHCTNILVSVPSKFVSIFTNEMIDEKQQRDAGP